MRNAFKKSAVAILAAIAAAGATAGPADIQVTQNLGVLATDVVIGDDGLAGGKTFDEFFQFTLPDSAAAAWTLTASVADAVGLSALSSDLYFGAVSTLSHGAGDPSPIANGQSFTDSSDPVSPTYWTFDPGTPNLANLAPGTYTLVVSGRTLADGGAFGGTLSIAAVPEPETYAMFLAGLGMLGAIARRRMGALGQLTTVALAGIR